MKEKEFIFEYNDDIKLKRSAIDIQALDSFTEKVSPGTSPFKGYKIYPKDETIGESIQKELSNLKLPFTVGTDKIGNYIALIDSEKKWKVTIIS